MAGGQEYDAEPGALVFIPAGTWISLKNSGKENISLVFCLERAWLRGNEVFATKTDVQENLFGDMDGTFVESWISAQYVCGCSGPAGTVCRPGLRGCSSYRPADRAVFPNTKTRKAN